MPGRTGHTSAGVSALDLLGDLHSKAQRQAGIQRGEMLRRGACWGPAGTNPLGVCLPRDVRGKSSCLCGVCSHLIYKFPVVLFSDAPGRFGFSSGALGMLMSRAQKPVSKPMFPLEEEQRAFVSSSLSILPPAFLFTLLLLLGSSGVLEHSSGIFYGVLFCCKHFHSCWALCCCYTLMFILFFTLSRLMCSSFNPWCNCCSDGQ